jgi:hypothetical protein
MFKYIIEKNEILILIHSAAIELASTYINLSIQPTRKTTTGVTQQ